MKKIIILTFNGDIFYFVDDNFTIEQREELQRIADGIVKTKNSEPNEVCTQFEVAVNEKLGIILQAVKISMVVRIK